MRETVPLEALIPDALNGARLDKAAATLFTSLSRARLKTLIEAGAMSLGGRVETSPKAKVQAGQVLVLDLPEVLDAVLKPEAIPLDIVYEDPQLLIVNKPAGLVVHPGAGNLSGTLVNALLHHCGDRLRGIGGQRRPGIVHRLDKDTSGLLVVAKDEISLRGLQKQFQQRVIDRHYQALVWGLVPTANSRIEAPIGRHPRDRLRMAVREGGRRAVTHFQLVEAFGTFACQLVCRLETGRTHQIRVHFEHSGHPLLGDPLYGPPKRRLVAAAPPAALAALRALPGQALHAAELGLTHPHTGKRLRFEVGLPEAFATVVENLRSFKQTW